MSEYRYTPSPYDIAESLVDLAQDVEIGKVVRVSVSTPPFLREAAACMSRQAQEIERLRSALREYAEIAKEALGDE